MTCPGTLSGTMSHRDKKSVEIPQSLGDRGTVPISLKRKRESAEPDLARASRFLSVRAGAPVRQRPLHHRFTATNHQAPVFDLQTRKLSQGLAVLDPEAVGVSGGRKAPGLSGGAQAGPAGGPHTSAPGRRPPRTAARLMNAVNRLAGAVSRPIS
jgi:hypothetical protein